MENKKVWFELIQELKIDNSKKQKKGLHFMLASILIWTAIGVIHSTNLPILTKNLYTFCCSAPLFPLALFFSKLLNIEFQNKENPLTSMGILAAANQMLYILIAMWVYRSVPDKMLMVYAIIFGAHFLPYGWLYQSRVYYVFAIVIPIAVLAVGLLYPAAVVAFMMTGVQIVLSACLWLEVRQLFGKEK